MTRFVYCEDDPGNREVLQIILSRILGYDNVTIFEDTDDILNRLDMLPYLPDIIFLDVHIEPYSGIEVLHMMRAEPRYNDIRIVALTASVTATDVEGLRAAGFDAMISKPVKIQLLPDQISQILAGEALWAVY